MANLAAFLDLCDKTGKHLSGHDLITRFKYPPTANALGEFYSLVFGTRVIDIRPGLPWLKAYRVALHEIAHAKLHYEIAPKTSPRDERPGSFVLAHTAKPTIAARLFEDPVELQAAKWAAWAEQESVKFINPGDDDQVKVTVYLTVLNFYKE